MTAASITTRLPGRRKALPDHEKSGHAQIRNHARKATKPSRKARWRFHFAKPANFDFKPGQSMNVSLVDPPGDRRQGQHTHLSIVSAPHERAGDRNLHARDTAFKRVLKSMTAGGRVSLRGPAGLFTLDPADTRPAVFLAGGIGITPFVSMLRGAAHSGLARDLWLFYQPASRGRGLSRRD